MGSKFSIEAVQSAEGPIVEIMKKRDLGIKA